MTLGIPCCLQMQHALGDSDIPLIWTPKFREIGVRVLDGGDSSILLRFCPWCGNQLPESLRSEWFEELERREVDPYGDGIPVEFLDERWYESGQGGDPGAP